jgi:hypothetical protein
MSHGTGIVAYGVTKNVYSVVSGVKNDVTSVHDAVCCVHENSDIQMIYLPKCTCPTIAGNISSLQT